jgi:hypothetical protein
MLITHIVERLNNLQRYKHRICSDGEGSIDDYPDECDTGDYVLWSDIELLIKDIRK